MKDQAEFVVRFELSKLVSVEILTLVKVCDGC